MKQVQSHNNTLEMRNGYSFLLTFQKTGKTTCRERKDAGENTNPKIQHGIASRQPARLGDENPLAYCAGLFSVDVEERNETRNTPYCASLVLCIDGES